MSTPTRHPLDDVCDLAFVEAAPACFGIVRDGHRLRLADHGPHLARVDDLIGFTAPAGWSGIAFVGDGRGVRLDDRSEQRLRMTFVLLRTGDHASSITSELGTDRLGGTGLADDRPIGHVADLCHRALRMPAAPEPTGPDRADLARWLEQVLRVHAVLGPALDLGDWDGLLSLHPRLGAPTGRTWDAVHQGLVDLGCGWGRITADEVAWMDAPTWARYVLDEVPRIEPLMAELSELLPESTLTRVERMIAAT